jgi:hypothetical protein
MTFPRSGHGLLHRLLDRYFDSGALAYCEMYDDPRRRMEAEPRTNFQKNHDFDLDTPVRADRQYLVQVRAPIESIVSWYLYACDRGLVADARDAWKIWAVEKASFWMRFYRRWVLDDVPRRLVVNYADLVAAPEVTLARVVRFLADEAPDAARIAASCRAEPIARRADVRDFRHYGASFFATLAGLFAAVPGIDHVHGRLTVPGRGPEDPLRRAADRGAVRMRALAAELVEIAGSLAAASAARSAGGERTADRADRAPSRA